MQMTHDTPPTMPLAVVDNLCGLMNDIVGTSTQPAHATVGSRAPR
jgi:hypothetical protein